MARIVTTRARVGVDGGDGVEPGEVVGAAAGWDIGRAMHNGCG